jgi:hypothetical protein
VKKNHDFTPKNHIFSNYGGRYENFWGISCEKSYFFQLFEGNMNFSIALVALIFRNFA